ncbi:MAG TPA: hypothetical protein VMM56_07665 [Planctomycetaceae bacterium]|nr:hypothetical protein [Planctomycetaceae bacterium]
MSVTSYLDRFLDSVTAAFTPEMAQAVVGLRADAEMQDRIEILRAKANEGR